MPFALVMMKNGISVATFVPLLLSLSFYTGALPHLMKARNYVKVTLAPDYTVHEERIKLLILILLALYIVFRFFFLVKIFSQGGILSIFSIMQNASVARYVYGETESVSLFFQIGSIFYYCLMGAIGSLISFRFRLSLLLIVSLLIFIEMMEGTRARALIGITIFVVEYALAKNSTLLRKSFISYSLYFIIFFIVLSIIFFIPQYARVYNADNAIEMIIFDKFPSYTIAMYEALCLWINERDLFVLDIGLNTFSGIAKFFGIDFQQGFYEFTQTSYGMTNIYTNMRNILSDFGIIFSVFIYFIVGYIIGLASLKKVRFSMLILVKLSMIFLLFPLYSPFIFANVVVGVLLSFIFYMFFSACKIRF